MHPHLTSPRGRGILLLAVALFLCGNCGGAVCGMPPRVNVSVAEDYNALFRQEHGWIGADGSASVALSRDVTLWLYADTWVGEIRQGKRANASMINNSVALLRGKGPAKASVEFFYRRKADGKPASQFVPADGRGFFWPLAGIRTRRGLFLFAAQVEKTSGSGAFAFRPVAGCLLRIAEPDQPPAQWRPQQWKIPCAEISPQREKSCGCALLEHEGFVYIYGCDDEIASGFHRKHMILARAAADELESFDRWQFYGGGQWQSDPAKTQRLFAGAANEYSVSYQAALKQFVAVFTPGGMSEKIQIRLASRPEGPWGDPITIYHCPEVEWDKRIFCYAAKGHPSVSRAPDELIVTYVANSTDFWYTAAHAEIYFPRFLRVRFEAAEPAENRSENQRAIRLSKRTGERARPRDAVTGR